MEEPCCVCDRWTSQNAAHLLGCPWDVGDGRGRMSERLWKWCEAVPDFIVWFVDSAGTAGTGPCGREKLPGNPRSCSLLPYSR